MAILVAPLKVQSQSRAELERKKNNLRKEIQFTNDLIKKSKSSQKANLKKLSVLKKQISTRKEMMSTIQNELTVLEKSHKEIQRKSDSLGLELNQIITEYGDLLNKTYLVNQSKNSWLYLLSSADMNIAMQKWIYLRQFNRFRKSQYDNIQTTNEILNQNLLKLDSLKAEQTALLNEEKQQIKKLNDDIGLKNEMLSSLKTDEQKLRTKLNQQEKDNAKLTASIEKIIREEMAKAEAKAKSNELKEMPKAAKLSSDFKSNKGKFSWPVEKGYVSSSFGKQAHPTIKNLHIQNNGIDIRTEKNAGVIAIFEGDVVGVVSVPGNNYMVIIRHGNYYSVYSNLENVRVKREQKVSRGQSLGIVYFDEEVEASELHFEIWEGKSKHNPATWLIKR